MANLRSRSSPPRNRRPTVAQALAPAAPALVSAPLFPWGRLAACAPIANRRSRRFPNAARLFKPVHHPGSLPAEHLSLCHLPPQEPTDAL
jgi:hypothetical protein